MSCMGRGWWRVLNSRESPCSQGKGLPCSQGLFPPPTLIFYFLFQKAKQKQKQVSQKGTWAGRSWMLALGTLLVSHC